MPEHQKNQQQKYKTQTIRTDPSPQKETANEDQEETKVTKDLGLKAPTQIAEYMNGGLTNDYDS